MIEIIASNVEYSVIWFLTDLGENLFFVIEQEANDKILFIISRYSENYKKIKSRTTDKFFTFYYSNLIRLVVLVN